MRNVNRVFRTIVIASAVALVSIAVHGTTIRLTADLKASAEVPPKDSSMRSTSERQREGTPAPGLG